MTQPITYPQPGKTKTPNSRIDVLNVIGGPIGFIDFTAEFNTWILSCTALSIQPRMSISAKRIKSAIAIAAFGALKSAFTNAHVDIKLKEGIHVALCPCDAGATTSGIAGGGPLENGCAGHAGI